MTWRIAPTAFGLAAIRARTRLLRSTWRVSLRSVLRFFGVVTTLMPPFVLGLWAAEA